MRFRTPQIDHAQVCAMTRLGFPQNEIATRLNCTERQVRRIVQKYQVNRNRLALRRLRKDEIALWRTLFEKYGSYSKVAWLVGRTRQLIFDGLINHV